MKYLAAGSLAIAFALILAGCSRPQAAPEPVRAVLTARVENGQAVGTHEFAAEVRARTESRLSFRVAGKVQQRLVNVGDSVRPGQVLARLDPQDLRLGQDAARAAVGAAEVQTQQAAADFRRFKDLRDQGFISAAELERRETTLKAAQAQLEQARAQAGVQVNQAGYANLLSDAAGVVTAAMGEPGMVVAAGTPIVQVAIDGPLDVVFSVPEDRLPEVRAWIGRPGAVKVRPWGQPEAAIAGTVREVAAAADPATRTFLVKADVGRAAKTDLAAGLRLGQTVTVLIDKPAAVGIARLPLAAVFEHQGKAAVWLLDGATLTVRHQPVAVGGAAGNEVVILAGLQPGQEVVTAGVHTLTSGQKVKRYVTNPAAAVAASASAPAAAASR